MNLRILTEFDYDNNLFKGVDTKTTDFAKREGKGYEGWCVEEVDCNGAYPAIYKEDGGFHSISLNNPYVGIRPAVNYNEIALSSKVIKEYENGLKEVEFGEYPQDKVEDYLQEHISQKLLTGKLNETGKNYTIYNNDEEHPDVIRLKEVQDEFGDKYVYKDDTWYKVSPVRWIVSEKANIALTKYMIQGGIPYGEYVVEIQEWEKDIQMKLPPYVRRMHEQRRKNPTIIEGFLNVVLSKDIMKSDKKNLEQAKEKEINHRLPLYKSPIAQRMYDSIFDRRDPSSEECLQKLIESLSDEKIGLEAARKFLHPRLQEQYIEGKKELRKSLINYKKSK